MDLNLIQGAAWVKLSENIYMLAMILFGLVTNAISLRIFHLKYLRNKSLSRVNTLFPSNPNFMLVVVSTSDILYLLSILALKIPDILYTSKHDVWCKLSTYFTFVFHFISSWALCIYNLERFFTIFTLSKGMTSRIKKLLVVFIATLSFLLFAAVPYIFEVWTVQEYDEEICFIKVRYFKEYPGLIESVIFTKYMTESFVTFLINFVVNAIICVKLLRSFYSYIRGGERRGMFGAVGRFVTSFSTTILSDQSTVLMNGSESPGSSVRVSITVKSNQILKKQLMGSIKLLLVNLFSTVIDTLMLVSVMSILNNGINHLPSLFILGISECLAFVKCTLNLFFYAFDLRFMKLRTLFKGY